MNDILSGNTQGYSCHQENEVIPLKRFLKCDHCGTAMRGYIVKSKNLPYYKCNTKGCCNNKSAKDLHTIFEKGISYLTLTTDKVDIKSLIIKQMIATYNNATKEQENDRLTLKKQAEEIDKKIDRLEERLVIEEITPDIFTKFVAKFKKEKLELERVLLYTGKKVSNLKECVANAVEFLMKLPQMWDLLPYKDKQAFQNLIFPEGIWYNKKTGQCRTTKVNSVFLYIARITGSLLKIKSGESKFIFDIPALVVPPVL